MIRPALVTLVCLGLAACGDDGATAPIDAAPIVCAAAPCTILPQSGCPGPPGTQACDIDSFGCTVCRLVLGSGMESTDCNGPADCALGYHCTGTLGRCVAFCDSDGPCPGRGLCTEPVVANGAVVPGVKACSSECTPGVGNARCPGGWACHIYREPSGRFYPNCDRSFLGGEAGDPCEVPTDCAADVDCMPDLTGTGRHCRRMCSCLDGDCPHNGFCGGMGTCHSLSPPIVIGEFGTWGACY